MPTVYTRQQYYNIEHLVGQLYEVPAGSPSYGHGLRICKEREDGNAGLSIVLSQCSEQDRGQIHFIGSPQLLVYAKLNMSATSVTSVSKQSSPLENYAAKEREVRKESRNVPAVPKITVPFLGDESRGVDR
jgi:hypothetical protein